MQRKTVVEMTLSGADGQPEKKQVECDDGVETAVQRLLNETDGRRVLSIDTLRPSLEDVFVQLTGLSAEVMLSEKGGKGPVLSRRAEPVEAAGKGGSNAGG
jgi:hypothetical protein